MHTPVLADEVVRLLDVKEGGTYIDATIGGGGHAELILAKTGPEGRLLGIDKDEEAIKRAKARLERRCQQQCFFEHGNFAEVSAISKRYGLVAVDGVLFDLGVSSDQLETPERGFSFLRDGPLDMRMDASCGQTAADLVNGLSVEELAGVIHRFGEERGARRIARALVDRRRLGAITTTGELAEVVLAVKGGRRGRIHPATRVFQALRIAVNDEIGALAPGIEDGLRCLKTGGRLAVISFHSLEDRIVKRRFREHVGHRVSLEEGGTSLTQMAPAVSAVTRKPVTPTADELKRNPRARTAKLRAVEKTACSEGGDCK